MKDTIKKIHFVGIKGVGQTPLAIIAKEAGMQVSGSDTAETYITDTLLKKAAIPVEKKFSEKNIKKVDLVITTGAHGGYDNIEVQTAKKMAIPVMTQGEAVGYFMSGKPFNRHDMEGISVVGCHGKTTTTAMIATILQSAKQDPSFVIGTGLVASLGSSGYYGKGKYFVAEADEYATEPVHNKTPKFMWQHPKLAVVTNIEYDHPDLYPTFASLVTAYKKFIAQVFADGGKIVACGDDPEVQKIVKNEKNKIITYGFNSNNDYVVENVASIIGGMEFRVSHQGEPFGTFRINVLGKHNVLNGLASSIVAHELGLSIAKIQQGLADFVGTKRRLEFVGNTQEGAAVFDDYAHHPTEIKKTLEALRERYQNSNIICVFQPHTFSRTKLLFKEFTNAFDAVNTVIFTDIFASAREAFDNTVSSKDLQIAANKKQNALYLPSLDDVTAYFRQEKPKSDTIIVTMGAGNVYQIAYAIITH